MPNVADAVWRHATERPAAVALRARGRTWSFADLRERAAAFAGLLRAEGVRPGHRVVLVAPSVPEFAVVSTAVHAVGAVLVTLNTMATAPEIGYVLDDSGARLALAWHETATAVEKAAAERGLPLLVLRPDLPVGGGAPLSEPVGRGADDTALLLYTSGTTGRPKGVEITVDNLDFTAAAFAEQLALTPDDRFGSGLPLFHVFGQAVCLNGALRVGCSLSLLSPFEPNAMLRMVRDDRVTVLAGVPTMWNAMLHADDDFGADDFPALRLAGSGGASLPGEVIREFQERFGCTILEGYGLTESTGAGSFNSPALGPRTGSVGPALPGTTVEIRDPAGEILPTGEVGEVHLRGPHVMKGYWNRPEATAADLPDGRLRTGDLGRLDEDGFLYIVDRLKDLVIRGGYNVYPREVEEVLYGHPDIVEAAVIGVPDPHYGEEVAAVVTLRPGAALTAEELRGWAKERLSAYKVPHLVRFVDALPKGSTGKILKRALDWDTLPD
ncbi:long-chain fatty acid--CoA ligase [Streptomyces sp. SID13726]|uniref:long-chain-fatty-acid--CoA ligase n=1 Tax=Streptomyces sp. SID13726 TaxID=2706058 RepID=UPI0013B88966|nr:long-chain fatty acid--CoA ligase [Streptomyces sp. SID13726]NEA98935.1 long-chain fatty acid--CoA ligase [Streptomyces sp. SID13726]